MNNILEELNLQKRKRYDNFFTGFIPSIILPAILIVVISAGKTLGELSFTEQFLRIYNNIEFVNIAILALMPNMIAFFFFYKTERWKAASGLIVATIFYIILMVVRF